MMDKLVFVDLFEAPHQRPPCVKGAGFCEAKDWGIDGKMLRIRRNHHIFSHFLRQSLRHGFAVPPPFAQGRLLDCANMTERQTQILKSAQNKKGGRRPPNIFSISYPVWDCPCPISPIFSRDPYETFHLVKQPICRYNEDTKKE